ncbi:aminotransferase class I/II-fold pyridoxal phosphate-dependent enzyme [Microaerobacter geothermalis]|uniref:aminotransferase class I/II-fold pyridoxal phosphate-dependent enzyme n=1 Tax=Microaerobacter geothermalis TaxID=674972 RepID=UPI001F2844F1|nr:aminotransferase class I/II-fold pyridoxal phosphate-dependent enzyme [Microaerobacter geothermalis]MCF6094224.1 aminotransferase class I/II-fold pyridoxal phosphate-dependent enzyme [Microaerobacter geothermalis]
MKFSTQIIHNPYKVDPYTGACSTPIYQASTYHQFDVDQPGPYDYARSGNPTRHALEETIALLEGGCRGFAFSSGMAAISTVFLLLSSGDHVVISEDVYGGTHRIVTQVLSRLGISATFVDTTDINAVEEAIKPNTKAIYVETPSNPLLKVTDLGKIEEIAKQSKLLFIVDNTFLTPYYQRPIQFGADIVIHSATKFIAGHSDVIAGLVVAKNEELAEKIGFLQNSFGAILGVQDSWLVLRGLKTLKVRLDSATNGAKIIANWLKEQSYVKEVYYTGLPTHQGHDIQNKQVTGHGAVLSFDVGNASMAKKIMKRVKIPAVAVSLGSVESILSYPALMSHAAMPEEERRKRGIHDGLLRLSVGLEDPHDLIEDLEQAMLPRLVSSRALYE